MTKLAARVASLRVEHTPEGLNKLIAFLREIAPLDQVVCNLETNHGLLISTFWEAGLSLYPVNPKTVDRKRSVSGARARFDRCLSLSKTWPLGTG